MEKSKTKMITKCAMLAALAGIVMLFEFVVPFVPPFYKLDISEVIILLSGFALGPIAAVICEALKIFINLLLNGTTTMGIGELANFLMGCAFVLPASIYYKKQKTKKSAFIGLIIGTITLCIVATILNYFILLPVYAYFFKVPIDSLIAMGTAVNGNIDSLFSLVMLAVIPFNLLKGVLTSTIVLFTYKKISPLLKK